MSAGQAHYPPIRIADLVAHKQQGKEVTCQTEFRIHQVEFRHRDAPYDAYLFFCYFSGQIEGADYTFRKCYAKGCPQNLCPNVSQAVMIANRYLQRDIHTLQGAGIQVSEQLFSLPEMMVGFDDAAQAHTPEESIEHFMELAAGGEKISVQVEPEFVPAHENFEGEIEPQVFLVANLSISHQGKTSEAQRCFSCYAAEDEDEKKPLAVLVARQRMSDLYKEFDQAGVDYQPRFFD